MKALAAAATFPDDAFRVTYNVAYSTPYRETIAAADTTGELSVRMLPQILGVDLLLMAIFGRVSTVTHESRRFHLTFPE